MLMLCSLSFYFHITTEKKFLLCFSLRFHLKKTSPLKLIICKGETPTHLLTFDSGIKAKAISRNAFTKVSRISKSGRGLT